MYKYIKYRLVKNQVTNKISKQYLRRKKLKENWPFKNKLFICQLKTPGTIVKLHKDIRIPICSNQVKENTPPIIRISDKPLNLSIKIPNQIKVKALLQQQNINIKSASS